VTPPDTVPWVAEADLRDVSDAKDAALRQWEARLTALHEAYQTHNQRLRPVQTHMEERLLRAFAGLINQLRQQDLGIETYIWRSRDDAKVRDRHAANDDRLFRWVIQPEGGHPGQAHNCHCTAEPVAPGSQSGVILADFAPAANSFPAGDCAQRMDLCRVGHIPHPFAPPACVRDCRQSGGPGRGGGAPDLRLAWRGV
jgi:hypothetical protein